MKQRAGGFFVNTLVGGLLVVVPIYLAVLLLLKAMKSLGGLVRPMAMLLPDSLPAENILSLLLVLLICFLVGFAVRSQTGRAVRERMERSLFERIPGYALIRSLTQRLAGENRENVWQPALAEIEEALVPAFIIEELTDLVEEAVLKEFEAIASRGGVLGAMETGYQRGKIQEESMYYEHKKHDGSYPIIGVNTFLNPQGMAQQEIELARSTDEEKQSQIKRLRDFHARNASTAPAMLEKLKQTVIEDGNVFAVLVDAVKCCSLGQISSALYEVGGQYRRSM